MKTRTFLIPLLVATGVFCGTAYQAAAQAGPGGRGMGGVLTQEQRTKLREAMQASQTEVTQLNEKLAAAQKEAIKAALAKNADEKTVRPKVEAVNKIQVEIAMLRLKAIKEIASSITDEQKTQIDERPGMTYQMLLGNFGGMMGGRRGGGGGGGGTQ